ncbi:FxSxx-COOH system tetratricopeptide repeat protein [Micromonospora eburnea]|uniref:Tetratricopeptide repeat-containing protein n=1 Tax=Micromonospora eburnea TaxID=227316 RepID=A0A1C6UQN5_9ACTN|nr:FxSxx-COOH system tetratricopeptide repeat protein [Micromonospora eburnea]SCL56261.1 Tetratricopeptide repeat-containing protein [Micromonospora eburnea]
MATTDPAGGPSTLAGVPHHRPAPGRAARPGSDETSGTCTIVSFVSPTNGTGRSSAVANVAWILAGNGKRVLAVDWCARTPRVYDYLRSFQVDAVPAAGVLGGELATLICPHPDGPSHRSAAVIAPPAPEQGTLYRYAVPGSSFGFDMVGVGVDAEARPEGDPARIRQLLQHAAYDYVLIDTPVDLTLSGITHTAVLSDVAVVCMPPRRQAMQQAAELTGQLQRQATGGIRVLAAPTLRDVSQPWYGEDRDSARRAFARLLDGSVRDGSAVEIVEVPQQSYDTYDDVLAALADPPGDETSLLAAYERMASWISGGTVVAAAVVPERIRRRYRRGVLLERAESIDDIVVLYDPVDRPWADWIGGQLRRADVRVQRRAVRPGAPVVVEADTTVLAVLSPSVLRAVGTRLAAPPTGADADDVEVLGVLTTGRDPAQRVDPSRVVDLRTADGPRAQSLLLSRLGLIAPAQPGGDPRVASRYPGETDRRLRTNLPPRNESFVGRGEYLERLRDRLTDSSGPVTLTGGAGVGKSELAREFAHRFAYDYDLVWWIPAQDRETVQASLGELADEINAVDGAGAAESALVALSTPRGAVTRWLLVYDNADDGTVLSADLMPRSGAGHVLITSRDDGSSNLPAPLEVAAFTGDESVAMLRRVLGISTHDARSIAAALEHLPLALRLATAWIRQSARALERDGVPSLDAVSRCVAELLARLRLRPDVDQAERIPGSRTSTVARVLDITLSTLQHTEFGPLAIHLAELSAFLSPEGIGLPLLRSASMLTQLAAAAGVDPQELLLAAGEIDLVLTVGARFGLYDVDWGHGAALRMHRAIQVLLREGISEPQRRERHRQVLHGLAGYAPTDPEADDPRYADIFDELQRHLVPSGALETDDRQVRHWVVKQLRYLYLLNDSDAWQSALQLAEPACERWRAAGDPDQLTMRLFVQTANLHRALGHYQDALRLDEEVLSEQRRRHGLRHFRTLIAGRGRGGDLRGLGRFEDALVEDQATFAGFQEVVGDDHPNTRMAVNNLAISFLLTGDAREALRLARQERDRRMALFGPEDPRTWRASCQVGSFEREVGEYDQSLATLREALERVHELQAAGHLDELRVNRSLAVTERRLGLTIAAKKRSTETFRGYRDHLGEDHPLTRSSLLSLAVDYYRTGDAAIAVQHAIRCLRGYERQLEPGHPFSAACSVNLGVFQRGAGEYDQAVRDGERGLRALRTRLGDAHPWALTAATAQAGHLATRGEFDDAARLQEETHQTCVHYLGRRHPCSIDAAANLAAIRALRDGPSADGPSALTDTDIDVPQS